MTDKTSKHLDDFKFRHYEAGPRRDTARRFHDLAVDLNQELPSGDDKDACLTLLLEAQACALRAATSQLRPGTVVDS